MVQGPLKFLAELISLTSHLKQEKRVRVERGACTGGGRAHGLQIGPRWRVQEGHGGLCLRSTSSSCSSESLSACARVHACGGERSKRERGASDQDTGCEQAGRIDFAGPHDADQRMQDHMLIDGWINPG